MKNPLPIKFPKLKHELLEWIETASDLDVAEYIQYTGCHFCDYVIDKDIDYTGNGDIFRDENYEEYYIFDRNAFNSHIVNIILMDANAIKINALLSYGDDSAINILFDKEIINHCSRDFFRIFYNENFFNRIFFLRINDKRYEPIILFLLKYESTCLKDICQAVNENKYLQRYISFLFNETSKWQSNGHNIANSEEETIKLHYICDLILRSVFGWLIEKGGYGESSYSLTKNYPIQIKVNYIRNILNRLVYDEHSFDSNLYLYEKLFIQRLHTTYYKGEGDFPDWDSMKISVKNALYAHLERHENLKHQDRYNRQYAQRCRALHDLWIEPIGSDLGAEIGFKSWKLRKYDENCKEEFREFYNLYGYSGLFYLVKKSTGTSPDIVFKTEDCALLMDFVLLLTDPTNSEQLAKDMMEVLKGFSKWTINHLNLITPLEFDRRYVE